MSGYPRCASEAPSRKRTIAWTIEVGWTTTSIRSYGSPKRKCASISSSPLFASVAESTVIFGPMRHVGCASASARVTFASSSRDRPRNGPPDAVRTIESTDSRSRPSRHWKTAECSLSTGSRRPPPRSRARERELAGGNEALLVRERERHAALERPERRWEAREADDGVQDDVRLGQVEQRREIAADLDMAHSALGGQPVESVEPDASAHTSSSSLRVDDLERLAPDRARGAEDRDSLHRPKL